MVHGEFASQKPAFRGLKDQKGNPNDHLRIRPKQPQGSRQNDRKPPLEAAQKQWTIPSSSWTFWSNASFKNPQGQQKLCQNYQKFASTATTLLKPQTISSN
jgi:hypothetical protein